MWNAGLNGARSPFKNKSMVRRPIESPQNFEIEDYAKVEIIDAPRSVFLGIRLDEATGEEIEEFHLPLDDESHETSIAFIGGSGSGKTVGITRFLDELRWDYGRSVLIFDSKNQYIHMNEPNKDEKHIKILEEYGEKPRGVNNLRIYVPNHIIKKDGTEYCKMMYEYTNTWIIKTGNVDATGLLLLGNKELSGKDYVLILGGVVDSLKEDARENGVKFTIDNLIAQLEMEKEEMSAKKRSTDTLEVMIDALVKAGIISDDGNEILELFHKPKRRDGEVVIFNTAGSSPDDMQTKGLIANMISSICQELKLHINRKTKIPYYQPIIVVEEASIYYGRKTESKLLEAFNQLQNVMGRSAGILRTYVYQNEKQAADGLLDNDNMQIIINTKQSIILKDGMGTQMHGKGLAWVKIRNVSFMPDTEFLIKILPPKCEIGS